MQRFGLSIRETGYSDDYNPDVNACITSEFSTAAQRFGHSTVDGRFLYVFSFHIHSMIQYSFSRVFVLHQKCNRFFSVVFWYIRSVHKGNGEDEVIEIPDVFFNTNRLRQRNFYDEILLTLTRQPMQQVDSAVTQGVSQSILFTFTYYGFCFIWRKKKRFEKNFSKEAQNFYIILQLSKFLFRGSNPFGLDLATINVLRGRDHGIRPYNDYVEVTGHRKVTSFDEFGPGVSFSCCYCFCFVLQIVCFDS